MGKDEEIGETDKEKQYYGSDHKFRKVLNSWLLCKRSEYFDDSYYKEEIGSYDPDK